MEALLSSKKNIVKWLVVFAFVFGFGFLPPVGELTPVGMRVLGIFIGAIFGWTTIGILETTFVAIIGFGLTIGFNQFIASSFGTPLIAMMLVLFPICGMLNHYGVLQVLAQKFITTNFCEGHPWRICFMIIISAYICARFNALVVAVLYIEFVKSICEISNIKTPNKFSVAIMIGVVLAIMIGQLIIPVFGTPLVLISALTAITGVEVNLLKYMLLIIPIGAAILSVYTLCMKYVLKVDVEPLKAVTIESLGGKKYFTKDQKKATLVLLVTLIALVANSVIPKDLVIGQFISQKLGLFGIVCIVIGFLLFMKNENGERLFLFPRDAKKGMAWEPFFLAAFIVPFANYMTGGETGIAQTITSSMKPLFGLSPVLFLIIMYLAVNIITNFAQNTVVIISFLPLFFAYGQATGFPMEGFYILLFVVAQIAIATPGSSTPCGIVYSATDLIDVKLVLKMALKVMPFLFITMIGLGIPLTLLLY